MVLQHARLSLLLLVQATLCREQHLAQQAPSLAASTAGHSSDFRGEHTELLSAACMAVVLSGAQRQSSTAASAVV